MRSVHFNIMDEFSGLPLPIDPAYAETRSSRFPEDDHHPWHNRGDPFLQDEDGKALRASRVQRTNYDAHHLDYHGAGLRPDLPITRAERLRPMVLALADYVPAYGIAFGPGRKPYRTQLSDNVRRQLPASGRIRVANLGMARDFLLSALLEQDFSDVSPEAVEEFLFTTDSRRKWELGRNFLGRAARRAVEPVETIYQQASKDGLIPKAKGQTASRLVLGSLAVRERRKHVFNVLATKLAA